MTQVPLENSEGSHWKSSEIPLETSEYLLETCVTLLNNHCHCTEIHGCTSGSLELTKRVDF